MSEYLPKVTGLDQSGFSKHYVSVVIVEDGETKGATTFGVDDEQSVLRFHQAVNVAAMAFYHWSESESVVSWREAVRKALDEILVEREERR